MTKPLLPEDRDRKLFGDAIIGEMKQLANLLEQDLPIEDIAHRMAVKPAALRRVLKRMGVKHEGI